MAELLKAAPSLVMLATSRTVLRLSGEHEFPVPPLPVPPPGAGHDPADLQRYASVSLFAERAHAVAPGFELTDANAEAVAVAEICRRLDGLPLAIELAAARVRLRPPQALASRLDQRFTLLTGGPRDLPERQRTLKKTLDWSFDLLSAGEQALFARLGVFEATNRRLGVPAPAVRQKALASPAAGSASLGGRDERRSSGRRRGRSRLAGRRLGPADPLLLDHFRVRAAGAGAVRGRPVA